MRVHLGDHEFRRHYFLIPHCFRIDKVDIILQEPWQVSSSAPYFFASFDTFLTLATAKTTRACYQIILQIKLLQTTGTLDSLPLLIELYLLILKEPVYLQYVKSVHAEEVKIYLLHQVHLLTHLSLEENILYLWNFRKAVFSPTVNKVEPILILKKKAASVM